MDEWEKVMSVAHGELRHVGYEVDAQGRERAMYATDWEPAGSFLEPTESCTHGSYYVGDDEMRHCLTCPDVRSQPTVSEEAQ